MLLKSLNAGICLLVVVSSFRFLRIGGLVLGGVAHLSQKLQYCSFSFYAHLFDASKIKLYLCIRHIQVQLGNINIRTRFPKTISQHKKCLKIDYLAFTDSQLPWGLDYSSPNFLFSASICAAKVSNFDSLSLRALLNRSSSCFILISSSLYLSFILLSSEIVKYGIAFFT